MAGYKRCVNSPYIVFLLLITVTSMAEELTEQDNAGEIDQLLTVVEGSMSEETKATLKEAFDYADIYDDGMLTMEELQDYLVMDYIEMTDAELQAKVNEVDADRNGTLDFREFLSFVANDWKEPTEDIIKEITVDAFNKFDTDESGSVSEREVANIIWNHGEQLWATAPEVRKLVREAALDEDHAEISFEVFKKLMNWR